MYYVLCTMYYVLCTMYYVLYYIIVYYDIPYHATVAFHDFNLRIFNLRVSNPNKLIVDVLLTRCRISMCQGLGPKKTMKFRKSTVMQIRTLTKSEGQTFDPHPHPGGFTKLPECPVTSLVVVLGFHWQWGWGSKG